MTTYQLCSDCGKKCRSTVNMCPTCYPRPSRSSLIGSKWTNSNGRTWEVTEMVSPGKFRVCSFVTLDNGSRIATRIGEMYVRSIRAAIAAAEGGAA